ncbi:hypothetical protein [Nonomuraea sp. NPDC050310]|uniref:hypothetical protein n=1 Tax=Nonomuraea sp. NPDC050310 TaxID=3154935 RepID=UPI0033CCDF56
MRIKGVSYDTGFVLNGRVGRAAQFDRDLVEHELRVIRDELHCTAVRVMGGDPDRIELAATIAAGLGLEVWFSPYPLEQSQAQMLELFADCAERAERLRRTGASVVFVTGAEHSLMNPGFVAGRDTDERLRRLLDPATVREQVGPLAERLNAFLRQAVAVVRERFAGPVTYAAIQLERVDWSLFDVLSMDLYRSADSAGRFADGVAQLVALGKPVAITEFGCATYRGAAGDGARGLEVIEVDADRVPVRVNGVRERDEAGQAREVRELLELFEAAGVEAAFVFTFALYDYPHRPGDPAADLDLGSYGLVRVLEGRPWEPKEAFEAVARFYRG